MQTMEAGLGLQKQIEEVLFLPGPVVLSRVPVLAAAVGSGAVCGLSCGFFSSDTVWNCCWDV